MGVATQERATDFEEGYLTGASMAHSGPAGRKLGNKYLDFSLLPPFYILPVFPIGQAQLKTREQMKLVIEPIGMILWGLKTGKDRGWGTGVSKEKTSSTRPKLPCLTFLLNQTVKVYLVLNNVCSPSSLGL